MLSRTVTRSNTGLTKGRKPSAVRVMEERKANTERPAEDYVNSPWEQ